MNGSLVSCATLLAPITVADKLAVILWADNGVRGIPPKRVAGVLMLTQKAAVALERLIRRKKAQLGSSAEELDESRLEFGGLA